MTRSSSGASPTGLHDCASLIGSGMIIIADGRLIQSIGIAVPAELRSFVFPLNWPRIVVDSVVQRQQVKSFSVPNDDKVSNELRDLWEYTTWNRSRCFCTRRHACRATASYA